VRFDLIFAIMAVCCNCVYFYFNTFSLSTLHNATGSMHISMSLVLLENFHASLEAAFPRRVFASIYVDFHPMFVNHTH